MDSKEALLLLNRVPNLGPRRIKKLLAFFLKPEEIFKASKKSLFAAGMPEHLILNIRAACNKQKIIEEDFKWETDPQHTLLTIIDSNYPKILKEIADPPPVLYACGELNALVQPCLAIIGTRNPSVGAAQIAFNWSAELCKQGITIVSGLARGIDGQVHKGTVSVQQKTIAVLGAGIDCIYPKQHARLFNEIQSGGLLISEFPLGTMPLAGHFPRRNRIISGLSLATLVIEATLKSGSLITAELALDQNRGVMAVPGSVHNPQVTGCHTLIQQGAALVTSPQEVLEELCIDKRLGGSCKELDSPLMGGTGSLTTFIGFDVTSVDEIVTRSSLPVEDVITDLAELELQGHVRAVPGGYIRCML